MVIQVPTGTMEAAARRIQHAVVLGVVNRDFTVLLKQVLADLDLEVVAEGAVRTEA